MRKYAWIMRRFIFMVLAMALLGTIAWGDTLKLKDGRVLEGYFQGGSASVIKFELNGKIQDIPVETVMSLTFKGPAKQTAPPAPPPPKAAYSGPVTINAGTRLMVRMGNSLDTGTTKSGERFTAALEADLVVNGTLVAAKGSQVYGKVLESVKAKRVRGRAKLIFELTDIKIRGQLQPIVTDQMGYEGDRSGTLKKVGAAAGVGAIIDGGSGAKKGALVGGGLAVLTKGKQIQIPAGTLLEFRFQQPLTVKL